MKTFFKLAAASSLAIASYTQAEVAVNASFSNNYIWRGLTQTTDGPAISGGIDYSSASGFYAGTWVSNVDYGADDAYSYEHDLYLGFSGEAGAISYDIGYLYVNYNEDPKYDFSEVYGTIGISDFSATLYLLAHTEQDEEDYAAEGEVVGTADFGFASAYYLSLDYGIALPQDYSLGLHAGYHEGDFVNAFNFGDGTYSYIDYSISLSKEAFSFTVSQTDLDDSPESLNNDDMKFVVAYSFEL